MRTFAADRGKNRSQAKPPAPATGGVGAFPTGGRGFVAQRGFARSDPRSVLTHPPEHLRRWQRFWALVAQAFLPVWFKQLGIPKPHWQECLCYNAAQPRPEITEPCASASAPLDFLHGLPVILTALILMAACV